MTPLQACQETKELWTKMARGAEVDKKAYGKYQISGPWQHYPHNCPCCEYNMKNRGYTSCSRCPMEPEFRYYSGDVPNTFCEWPKSPYYKWGALMENDPCIDVEFFCLLMAELAQEAEERHIKESLG